MTRTIMTKYCAKKVPKNIYFNEERQCDCIQLSKDYLSDKICVKTVVQPEIHRSCLLFQDAKKNRNVDPDPVGSAFI